ncbi:hypothetical protein [uncultured Zobellia sp.]|uniref:hypothetical protein n=1 Tax=uncultured Zobellia sp. TaxID=255433 RepID=UPI002598BF1D|nr:hypothetical protein [uncultured Zobellia sp.]
MKKLAFLLLILIVNGLFTYGQENGIAEFDLYGCWNFQSSKDGQRLEKKVNESCPEAGKRLLRMNSKIKFLAYNKCEFQAVIQDAVCPIIYKTVEGTWTYSDTSGIIEMYYPKNFKAEFWERVKEDYPELKTPDPRPYMRFKIVSSDESGMEIEQLRTTMVSVAKVVNSQRNGFI